MLLDRCQILHRRLLPAVTRRTLVPASAFEPLFRVRMSSTSQRHEYLVIIPDHAGTLSKRLTVRGDHLKGVSPLVEKGVVTFGGATLDSEIKEGETPQMNGSVLTVSAESKDEVMQMLKNDVYSKSGVWNVDDVKIFNFKTAIRKAL